MSLQSTDQIADLITRIRNAILVSKNEVRVPTSKLKVAVIDGLKKGGYIADYDIEKSHPRDTLHVLINNEGDIAKINESVEFLMSGAVDYEFRTTIVKELHNADDIQDIVSWIKGAKKYYLQGFIDSGDLICSGYSGYNKNDLENMLNIAKNNFETVELRGI